jgi:serine/threonine-protein kinase
MADGFDRGELIDGRYRVLNRLGIGGMADVYLCEDLTLGRRVALKVLLSRYAGDGQFVERFRREAQAAAQINHPNIVNVYDWGMVGETYYIAMEYVEGETLKERIRRQGKLAPGEAVRITLELLAALDVAHAAGIVHRDVKSQNILMDAAGTAKVTDFGIARAGDSQMTEAGSILGTAQYLAPEQARGEPVDARSDLYSVGVVLYEMLTGRVPFQGDSAVTVALKHVNEVPPEPAELVPGLPYSLNQIVLKALAKDPERRYHSASSFAADLNNARTGGPLIAAAYDPSEEATQVQKAAPVATEGQTRVMPRPAAPPPERRRRRPVWPWVLLVAFVVVAAIVAALLLKSCTSSTVKVPSVVGQSEAAARAALDDDGFKVKAVDTYSDEFSSGFVAAQDPTAGSSLEKDGTVTISVSRGPVHTQLSDLSGMTPAQVQDYLKQFGLVGRQLSGSSDAVPKGHVYKQNPPAGTTVARGDTVKYWVSAGKPQVAVPDVTGETQSQATADIQAAGLQIGSISQQSSSSVPAGSVISQSPPAGQLVDQGTPVSITVSSGTPTPSPSPSLVAIPDVLGLPEAEAETKLTDAGFIVDPPKQMGSIQPPGTVVKVSPDVGALAPVGSSVTIWVAK